MSQQSYNITGTCKSFPGISLTLSSQPTLAGTPLLMLVISPQKNVVLIEMGGSRAADFRAANDAAAAGLSTLLAAQGHRTDQAPRAAPCVTATICLPCCSASSIPTKLFSRLLSRLYWLREEKAYRAFRLEAQAQA